MVWCQGLSHFPFQLCPHPTQLRVPATPKGPSKSPKPVPACAPRVLHKQKAWGTHLLFYPIIHQVFIGYLGGVLGRKVSKTGMVSILIELTFSWSREALI